MMSCAPPRQGRIGICTIPRLLFEGWRGGKWDRASCNHIRTKLASGPGETHGISVSLDRLLRAPWVRRHCGRGLVGVVSSFHESSFSSTLELDPMYRLLSLVKRYISTRAKPVANCSIC